MFPLLFAARLPVLPEHGTRIMVNSQNSCRFLALPAHGLWGLRAAFHGFSQGLVFMVAQLLVAPKVLQGFGV